MTGLTMKRTAIEWTEMTWNPITGCSKVSAGCAHCYAERMALRLQAMGQPRYARGFAVTIHEDKIDAPRHWQTPRMVFVNSMSDLFHERVPREVIQRIFATMNACPQHIFQVLTKRSTRLRDVANLVTWSPNIWAGVSVEDQRLLHRIDALRGVPAHVRFLSCEPLLGPLDRLPLDGVHWVIVGGESGPGARPMRPDWVRAIRDQCAAAAVPFFFKQWGGVQKGRTGRILDGRIHEAYPAALDAWRAAQLR